MLVVVLLFICVRPAPTAPSPLSQPDVGEGSRIANPDGAHPASHALQEAIGLGTPQAPRGLGKGVPRVKLGGALPSNVSAAHPVPPPRAEAKEGGVS